MKKLIVPPYGIKIIVNGRSHWVYLKLIVLFFLQFYSSFCFLFVSSHIYFMKWLIESREIKCQIINRCSSIREILEISFYTRISIMKNISSFIIKISSYSFNCIKYDKVMVEMQIRQVSPLWLQHSLHIEKAT